jgi:fumarate reductase flavoprotein subunit
MTQRYDTVVIGSGGAGLCAAIEARQTGSSVLVLEAASSIGGSTALSGGVILAADTSLQRELGVEDSTDAFYDRYMVLNRWSVEPNLARALCDDAGTAFESLRELGVEFTLLPSNSAEHVPRSHMAEGGGASIVKVLRRRAEESGAEIQLDSRVASLGREGESFHLTLAQGGEKFLASSVVIATGGIGASREMRERYYPDAAAFGDLTWCVSAPGCVGDGLELGGSAGAAITGENHGLSLVTPGFAQNFDVVPPAWLVFVNREGRRYVDEMMPYSMLTETTKRQSGGTAFAILDEATRAGAAPTDLTHQGVVSLDWNRQSIDANVETGRVVKATSLDELAAKAGIAGDVLTETVARYNADCGAGGDSQFFKDPAWMRPVATPPFYAAEIRPCLVALTCCGLRIDAAGRVLAETGSPIPGLFAAGETTGGVMKQYGGSGNSIANALVFGRRAGRSAAEAAREAAN